MLKFLLLEPSPVTHSDHLFATAVRHTDYNEQRVSLLSFLAHQMCLFCHHPSLLLHTHLVSGSGVQGFNGLATCKALCNNTEAGAGYTVDVSRTI